jgi:hypothetical protein
MNNYKPLVVQIARVTEAAAQAEKEGKFVEAHNLMSGLRNYVEGFAKSAERRLIDSHIAQGTFRGQPMIDVHTQHCCIIHGCNYRDDDCTVTKKLSTQSFPCEYC